MSDTDDAGGSQHLSGTIYAKRTVTPTPGPRTSKRLVPAQIAPKRQATETEIEPSLAVSSTSTRSRSENPPKPASKSSTEPSRQIKDHLVSPSPKAPRKTTVNRRTFGSVVKGQGKARTQDPVSQVQNKGTVLHEDLTFRTVKDLPPGCQVTSVELQDPELAEYYVGLPPLRYAYAVNERFVR